MKRLIDSQLQRWMVSERRKPLVVRGARQVGKTTTIQQLGRQRFEELATIDLERNRNWHGIFSGDLSAQRILSELRFVLDKAIVPGSTLLFLDEIQSCPRAIMALRYFFEEFPDLHVIAAGSLLEFAMSEISFPVGRVQFLTMYPMTFVEYLWATGKEKAATVVLSEPQRVGNTIHNQLLEDLKQYIFIGGMPESVRAYTAAGSLRESLSVQMELCEAYRQDFAKYAPRSDPYCLDAAFVGIARSIGQQVKYSRLVEGYSTPTIRKAFDLLTKARVATRVPAASPAGLPLGATASAKKFKALMVDIGLAQRLRGASVEAEYAKKDLLDIHQGAMAEQFVGQELLVSHFDELYYWARQAKSSSAEVDYLVTVDGSIVPVEVKSGAAGRLRSLHLLLKTHPDFPAGLVFSCGPYAELPRQRLIFLPLYYAYAATGAHGADLLARIGSTGGG